MADLASLVMSSVLDRVFGKFLPLESESRRHEPNRGSVHTRRVKVFLVEDSRILRERLLALLASIPGAVSCGHAAGAAEAIAAIEAAKPDAVVLDIQLASGNGFDVLRAVGGTTAVYVLTNFANEAYRRKAESLGARGFFDKSTEVERLRQALVQASA